MKKGLCVILVVVCSFLSDTLVYAEKQNPHIGICGSDFNIILRGEWNTLLEQAVVVVRTTDDQMWLFNFGPSGRSGKTFQSLRVKRSCVAKQGDFVSLDYQCVWERQVWTWSKIKRFLDGKMPGREYRGMVNAIEKYLREQKLI